MTTHVVALRPIVSPKSDVDAAYESLADAAAHLDAAVDAFSHLDKTLGRLAHDDGGLSDRALGLGHRTGKLRASVDALRAALALVEPEPRRNGRGNVG